MNYVLIFLSYVNYFELKFFRNDVYKVFFLKI